VDIRVGQEREARGKILCLGWGLNPDCPVCVSHTSSKTIYFLGNFVTCQQCWTGIKQRILTLEVNHKTSLCRYILQCEG
jgi:hypothetical protein